MVPSVYVAGSSREIPRVREAMRALVRAGCSIAGDWVEQVERHGSAGAGLDDRQRAECAVNDLGAIDRADGVLVLWPTTPSVGAYVELGYAIGQATSASSSLDQPCLVIAGEPEGGTIWHAYVRARRLGVICALDDDAVAALVSWLREREGE